MRINTLDATKVWKGFSLSFARLHNVGVPIFPFLLSYFHGFEAQCAVSAHSSGRPGLLRSRGLNSEGGVVQQERTVATLKVSSLCLPATDVPHSASKWSLHALMTH